MHSLIAVDYPELKRIYRHTLSDDKIRKNKLLPSLRVNLRASLQKFPAKNSAVTLRRLEYADSVISKPESDDEFAIGVFFGLYVYVCVCLFVYVCVCVCLCVCL